MMDMTGLRVVIANESHLSALTELSGIVLAEDHPDAPMVTDNTSEGIQQSLRHFDALNSDCVWFLIAFFRDQPACLATLTRVPKLDARLGFLYLDELYVIREYRRLYEAIGFNGNETLLYQFRFDHSNSQP